MRAHHERLGADADIDKCEDHHVLLELEAAFDSAVAQVSAGQDEETIPYVDEVFELIRSVMTKQGDQVRAAIAAMESCNCAKPIGGTGMSIMSTPDGATLVHWTDSGNIPEKGLLLKVVWGTGKAAYSAAAAEGKHNQVLRAEYVDFIGMHVICPDICQSMVKRKADRDKLPDFALRMIQVWNCAMASCNSTMIHPCAVCDVLGIKHKVPVCKRICLEVSA
jgi:hypothetical protein